MPGEARAAGRTRREARAAWWTRREARAANSLFSAKDEETLHQGNRGLQTLFSRGHVQTLSEGTLRLFLGALGALAKELAQVRGELGATPRCRLSVEVTERIEVRQSGRVQLDQGRPVQE